MERTRESILIFTVLFFSLVLRMWGVGYDLPYIFHSDEPRYIIIIQNIFKTGDLNPHFFNYPSLFFYINAFFYVPYYLIGKGIGIFKSTADILPPIILAMGVSKALTPSTVLLGRFVSILFGVGTVWLTYLSGKKLDSKFIGLLAALIIAVAPTNVWHSRMITPDTFVTFFISASLLLSILVFQQGKLWQYIMAGLCVGFAASSKYNGGLSVTILITAHILRLGKFSPKDFRIYLALLFCALGFVITTPYAILDYEKFLSDFILEARHYSTGHPGMEGDALKWYLSFMWQSGGFVYIFSLIEIIWGLFSRSKTSILLSVFPILYFVFISGFVVRNDRTFLPLTPVLFLLASSSIFRIQREIIKISTILHRKYQIYTILILIITSLIIPIQRTLNDSSRLILPDSRASARAWIEKYLPHGAYIAIESYSPFIEPSYFNVQGFMRIIDHDIGWYVQQGFDYIIFSQGMYGRFYNEPEKYSQEVMQYEKFFHKFRLVKIFNDGNYEIRVYKVK